MRSQFSDKLSCINLQKKFRLNNKHLGVQLDHLQANQLEHFEDLLAQSALGIHLMFDNSTIADVLKKPLEENSFFTEQNMSRAQDLLTSFLEKDSISGREHFLDSLNKEDKALLVRTYFHLVESTIQQSSEFQH